MAMAGRWVVGVVALVLGCRTATQSGPVSPEPEPEAAPTPASTENQYVSGSPEKPAEEEAAKPAEEEVPAAVAGIPAKVDTIAAARALVEAVADGIVGAGFERIVSPALVKQWPTKEHVLIFVVYPLEASKAGINTFIVGAPTRVIGVVPQGGNVIDAVRLDAAGRPTDADHFGELSMVYKAGRTCEHTRMEIVRDGSAGGAAVLRAIGSSGNNDFINIKAINALPVSATVDPDIPDKIVAINQEEGNIYYLMTWKHDME